MPSHLDVTSSTTLYLEAGLDHLYSPENDSDHEDGLAHSCSRRRGVLQTHQTALTIPATTAMGTPSIRAEMDPQQLADIIFSKRNRERSRQAAVADIFTKKIIDKRSDRRKMMARRSARPKVPPKARCWDWVVHDGDVHYACNGSSFSHYTRVDAWAYRLDDELPPVKVLGIGTVKLTAMRALDSDNLCELTLHSVLHVPSMPCNGISKHRLQMEEVSMSVWREAELLIMEPTGAYMCAGTREGSLHRLAVYDNAVKPASTLDPELTLSDLSLFASDPERVEDLGDASRKIAGVRKEQGFTINTGPHTKVES